MGFNKKILLHRERYDINESKNTYQLGIKAIYLSTNNKIYLVY